MIKNYTLIVFLTSYFVVQSQTRGMMMDSRDSTSYYTVTYENILPNGQSMTWFASDLIYEMEDSYLSTIDYSSSRRYYKWESAIKACPEGWHLPTYYEWMFLINKYGGVNAAKTALFGSNYPGARYENLYSKGEKINRSLLRIMTDGYLKPPFYSNTEYRIDYGRASYHWTSTIEEEETAWFIKLSWDYNGVTVKNYRKVNAMCVRCVQDY